MSLLEQLQEPFQDEKLWSSDQLSRALVSILERMSKHSDFKEKNVEVLFEDIHARHNLPSDRPKARIIRLQWQENMKTASLSLICNPSGSVKMPGLQVEMRSGLRLDELHKDPRSKTPFYRSSTSFMLKRGSTLQQVEQEFYKSLKVHYANPRVYKEIAAPEKADLQLIQP